MDVGMWESRVLSEISKSLWKPFCGFHRDVISTAVFVVTRRERAEIGGCGTLAGLPIVEPPTRSFVLGRPVWGLTGGSRFYFVASSVRKSVWTLVRQLRGPHLSTCA